jgi:DNA-binding CsgD family transcriptional regulator
MTASSSDRLIAEIYGAALAPSTWGSVMSQLMERAGAIGAAYILSHRKTGRVVWAEIVGCAAGTDHSYIEYYSGIDPYLPALQAAGRGSWLSLAQFGQQTALMRSEWYNDFIRPAGVADIAGKCLVDMPAGSAVLGLHFAREAPAGRVAAIAEFVEALEGAAALDLELRQRTSTQVASQYALNLADIGTAVIDDDRRLIETNAIADRIFSRADGITVRNGRLHLIRAFEAARFAKYLAAATSFPSGERRMQQMLVGHRSNATPYVLRIIPMGSEPILCRQARLLVLIKDPEDRLPTAADLGELFGLSPAESRLAAALVRGRGISQIAADTGVAVATLRGQMRAILKKVGVERQNQLLVTLSALGRGRSFG